MNIGIDARSLIEYKTGIGYYLNDLLINLLKIDNFNNYYLFSDRKIVFDKKEFNNVYLIVDNKHKIIKKTLWYMLDMSKLVQKYHVDIFWGTQHVLPFGLKKIPKLLTIHDLVCYEMPETMSFYNKLINKLFIPFSVRRADIIASVSLSTRSGIKKYFGSVIDLNKVKVIYLGSNISSVSENKENEFFENHLNIIPAKYILFIGTIEPRKNVQLLLKAYENIRKSKDLKLVLCGKVGWKSDNIMQAMKNHIYSSDIIYLNYVTNEEKYILMKNCFVFVFPSLYEGFGLPVIEAMKANAVTLISRSSSLNELVDMDELKFDTNDADELAAKILHLCNNPQEYDRLRSYCSNRGKDFNWENAAMEYLKIFDCLNGLYKQS